MVAVVPRGFASATPGSARRNTEAPVASGPRNRAVHALAVGERRKGTATAGELTHASGQKVPIPFLRVVMLTHNGPNLLGQQFPLPGPALVGVARAPVRIVPRGRGPVGDQCLGLLVPGPHLGHRQRPGAQVEAPHVRGQAAHLLLARADHLLEIPEARLDGSVMMPSKVELGRAGPQ